MKAKGTTTCKLRTDYVHIITGATLDCNDDFVHTKPWSATARVQEIMTCANSRFTERCAPTLHHGRARDRAEISPGRRRPESCKP